MAIIAAGIAVFVYSKETGVPASDEVKRNPLVTLVYNKFYIDEIYNIVIVKPLLIIGDVLSLIIEALFIDLIVNLTGIFTKASGEIARKAQVGSIGVYMFAMVIGMILFLVLNLHTLIF
ncbi:MAG: hypothetical protein DDT42_02137 [candidate division WS2 bacterium]|uniref:NADH-quinone oxidoreductase subunit L n=1 Tax=Psychracetigena formicireducens TaxID=2986056 RepID=A0A9E2BIK2_PSYF1|nr:hypothetical protein [Candidatus Psychracetigena formicireducens]